MPANEKFADIYETSTLASYGTLSSDFLKILLSIYEQYMLIWKSILVKISLF